MLARLAWWSVGRLVGFRGCQAEEQLSCGAADRVLWGWCVARAMRYADTDSTWCWLDLSTIHSPRKPAFLGPRVLPLLARLDEFYSVAEGVVDMAAEHVGNLVVPADRVAGFAEKFGEVL